MVQSIDYAEIMHLLRPDNPMEFRTRALIAFQYVSAARVGELLVYNHKRKGKHDLISYGLVKSNIFFGKDKISWKMPNFKTKNKRKRWKEPFVLREEKVLWGIIKGWLIQSPEQVFDLKESRVRQLLREQLKPYSSHILRKSRGTHLATLFGYNAYEIRDALGHISLETGTYYISTAGRENKLRSKLVEMNESPLEE